MGFCCTDCGEYFDSDDEWNDNDLCNRCYDKKFKIFKNERGLDNDFRRWRKIKN